MTHGKLIRAAKYQEKEYPPESRRGKTVEPPEIIEADIEIFDRVWKELAEEQNPKTISEPLPKAA